MSPGEEIRGVLEMLYGLAFADGQALEADRLRRIAKAGKPIEVDAEVVAAALNKILAARPTLDSLPAHPESPRTPNDPADNDLADKSVNAEAAEMLPDGPHEAVTRIVVGALAQMHDWLAWETGRSEEEVAEPDADEVVGRIFGALAPDVPARPAGPEEEESDEVLRQTIITEIAPIYADAELVPYVEPTDG